MISHACEIPACPWPCLSRVGRFLPWLALLVIFGVVQRCLFFYLALFGVACHCWRCLSLFDVVQRCLFFTWRYLALLAFAGVACRSLTLFDVVQRRLFFTWRCLPLLALLFSCCDHDGWLDPVLFFIVSLRR